MKHGDEMTLGFLSLTEIGPGDKGQASYTLNNLTDQFMIDIHSIGFGPCVAPDFRIVEILVNGEPRFAHGANPSSAELFLHRAPFPIGIARCGETITIIVGNKSAGWRPLECGLFARVIDRSKL